VGPSVSLRARGLASALACGSCGRPYRRPSAAGGDRVLEEAHDSEELIQRVAALDIGKAQLVCCVRVPGEGRRARRLQEVTTHKTMTRSLLAMSDRLGELGVTRVVMEATSDYWKPAFYLLEAVDGILERPGRLLGEADLGVGVAGFQLLDQLDDGELAFVHGLPPLEGWPLDGRGRGPERVDRPFGSVQPGYRLARPDPPTQKEPRRLCAGRVGAVVSGRRCRRGGRTGAGTQARGSTTRPAGRSRPWRLRGRGAALRAALQA
jgi:hypothetical protein